MCRRVVVVWSWLFAFACVRAVGADWPRFLGPNGDGISPEKGVNKRWKSRPPSELWRVRLTDDGYAGPSVAGGRVFIVDHEGTRDVVRALDLATGRELWRFEYEDLAKPNYGFARATPTVDGPRVYTLSATGNLFCLEAATGRKIWHVDLRKRFGGRPPKWNYAGSPLVDGERLVVTPGGPGAAVAALDKMTGRTIWRGGGSDLPGYATPVAAVIDEQRQYVVFTAQALIGVDAATGRLLWSVPWRTDWDVNAATPIVMGRDVFVTTDYSTGCGLVRVGPDGARVVWRNKEIRSHFSTGVLSGGYVYCTSVPGRLVCMDPLTGRVAWSRRGFERGGLCGVDRTIILCDGRTGDVVMIEMTPDAYRELGRIRPLGGQSWTAPVVADGKLLVRNREALVCLDLR
jgi:outer membrane protein assembly factor BamB